MTELTGAFWSVAEAAVRGTPALVAGWLLCRMLRRRAAALRHAVWVLALAGMPAVLVLSTVGPEWRVAALAPMERSLAQFSAPEAARTDETHGSAASLQAVAPVDQRDASLVTALALLWASLALFLLLRLAVGHVMNRRLLAKSRPIAPAWCESLPELRGHLPRIRHIRVVASDDIEAPQTWGIMAPVIAVPPASREWPVHVRRSVLLHELAHVRRLDSMHLLVGTCIAAIFWFHPLAWRALRGLREEMEGACDDAVLRAGVSAPGYAATLVELTRFGRAQVSRLSLVQRCAGDLERRVRGILDPARARDGARPRVALVTAAALPWFIALGAAQPVSRAAPAGGPVISGPASFRWVDASAEGWRVIDVVLRGRFELNADTTTLVAAAPGSRLRIEERDADGTVLRVVVAAQSYEQTAPGWTWSGAPPPPEGEALWRERVLPRLVRIAPEPAGAGASRGGDRDARSRPRDQDLTSFQAALRDLVAPILDSRAMVSTAATNAAVERVASSLWEDLDIVVTPDGIRVSATRGSFEQILPDLLLRELGADRAASRELHVALAEAGRRLERAWEARLEGSR
jgi:beta-lactamase regulating signal transducer with metallopeptidase domain